MLSYDSKTIFSVFVSINDQMEKKIMRRKTRTAYFAYSVSKMHKYFFIVRMEYISD